MELTREQQIAIFEDTQKLIKTNPALIVLTEKAKEEIKLYQEGFHSEKRPEYVNTRVSVDETRSFEAAKDLHIRHKRIAVLNFASAVNPGGGVATGAVAQEECLCRISNLYPCLVLPQLWEPFYKYHRELPHKNYSDRIIYSKGITVFKSDTDAPQTIDDWYDVDVITSPAPNLIGVENPNDNELSDIFKRRIRNILEVAMENEIQAIVLGAFGCGAFKNSPYLVAEAFKTVLEDEGYKKHFKEVIFAIKREGYECSNLSAFKEVLHGLSTEINNTRTDIPLIASVEMPSGRLLTDTFLNEYINYKNNNRFAGKKISILGDSLSTLVGYNPDGYAIFYEGDNCENSGVKQDTDTWWGMLINFFGGELLVNNSFAGSRVSGNLPSAGNSDERTGSLHKDETLPDVIIICLGLNDYGYGVRPQIEGTIALGDNHYEVNRFDYAYNAMLKKIKTNYPKAEIWCVLLYRNRIKGSTGPTFLEKPHGFYLEQYNNEIKRMAKMNQCNLIDFSELNIEPLHMPLEYESFDGSHPTKRGMSQLACMFIRKMCENADKYLSCSNGEHSFIPTFPAKQFNGNEMVSWRQECDVCEKCAAAGNTPKKKRPYILRVKNSEKHLIEKPTFRIGREKKDVDYCLSDNSAISRVHADIVTKSERYYLIDRKSTNKSFVNNQRVSSEIEVELKDGASIRLANEEFVFHYDDK